MLDLISLNKVLMRLCVFKKMYRNHQSVLTTTQVLSQSCC